MEENGDKIIVQQCLSPPNRWENRGGKSEFGKPFIEDCWREAQEVGFGFTSSIIFLQYFNA
jgi:hypothetical protein